MASSRRTYDTDVITLRTVFAKNPGNSNVPALRTLTADGQGGTYWAVPSTLGVNPAFNQIITSGGTYTADLSYNTFRLTAAENIGMTDGPPGSNQTYIYAKAFSQFDVSGENSVYAFLNNQLDSSVTFAGQGGITLRADPATNTLFFVGPASNAYTVSTGIYGFNQIKVVDAASTITSSIQGWNGNFLTATSPSTLLNFIGYNDIQMSTNTTTNSIFFTISTFTSQGYLDISANAYGAYPSTLSTVSSLYVQQSVFNSTIAYLSSYNGFGFSSVVSSINALAMSTGDQFYILTGLINAAATLVQLNNYSNAITNEMFSTTAGLGTLGYISTGAGGTIGSLQLISTVEGLGSAGYISSIGGVIGNITTENVVSTVQGLGTVGYVSSLSTITTSSIFNTGAISTYSLEVFGPATLTNSGSTILRGPIYLGGPTFIAGSLVGVPNTFVSPTNLNSTVTGLGTVRYISSTQLLSTVRGLGSAGYLSALRGFAISSGSVTASSINLLDPYTNAVNYLTVSSGSLLVNGAKIEGGGGGGGGGVAQIVAGTGINVTPAGGTGVVTIAATGATTAYVDTAISSFSTALGPVNQGGGGGGSFNFSTISSSYGSNFVTNLLTASTMTTANILPSQSNTWVAVGYGSSATNSIQTSTDGLTWSDVTIGGFSSAGKDVAYNGSLWVAVGNNGSSTGSIQYSGDGKNWSNAATGGFSSGGNGVAWNGSYWIAVGNNGSATTSIQISRDGVNWSGISSGGFSVRGEGVAWNGSYWVAVGLGANALAGLQYSLNGLNWISASSGGFSSGGKGVAWNGSLWVAAGDDTTRPASLQYSGDGRNWSNAVSGGFLSAAWKVAWNGKLWVAVGDESTALKSIQTSLDGSNWSDIVSGGFSAGNDGYGVAWNGFYWIATGIGASATDSIQRSFDGTNWTTITSGGFTSGAVSVGFSSNLAGGYRQQGLTILSQNIPLFLNSTNQIMAQPSSLLINNTLTIDGKFRRLGVNCNTPIYDVDVLGVGHFTTLSSFNLQVSSINGQIFGTVDPTAFTSTVAGLGQNYVSTSGLVSTTRGLQTSGFISTSALVSTTYGLQTSGFLSTSALVSTTYGLQTSGFLSTSALVSTTYGLQTSGFLSTSALVSTTYGLQTSGFLSTSALVSTTYGLQTSGFLSTPALVSTTLGLQTSGFLSTSALVSTTLGLQTSGFLSTPVLTSTVAGLGQRYVSSLINVTTLSSLTLNVSSINGALPGTGSGNGSSITVSTGQLYASSMSFVNVRPSSSNLWVAVGADETPSNTIKYSSDGINWTNSSSGGFAFSGVGVAYNGSMWVAVGNDSTESEMIRYSYDGRNWSGSQGLGFTSGGNGVAWNGSYWVAVGFHSTQNNTIQYSTDGINWLGSSGTGFTSGGYGVAWNGKVWVAVGQDSTANNAIKYSRNGRTWLNSTGDVFAGSVGYGVAWNGRMFVAVGAGEIMYSFDGIAWTKTGAGFSSDGNGVAWNGRMWVAVGIDSTPNNRIKYSFNGINWFNSSGTAFTVGGKSVAWNGSLWVAVGSDDFLNPNGSIRYSRDGISWFASSGPGFLVSVAFISEGYGVAYSSNVTPSYNQGNFEIEPQNIPNYLTSTNQLSFLPSTIIANNTLFVDATNRVGINTGIPQTDLDVNGIGRFLTLSTLALNVSSLNRLNPLIPSQLVSTTLGLQTSGFISTATIVSTGVGYLNSFSTQKVFASSIILGKTNSAFTLDVSGTTNLSTLFFTNTDQLNVINSNLFYVAVGTDSGGNTIQYSYDAFNWLNATGGFTANGQCVTYNGKIWVAGGDDSTAQNRLKWSSNGINWSNSRGGTTFGGAVIGVEWNGSMWVAVGGDSLNGSNTIRYSYDGITWRNANGGFTNSGSPPTGWGIAWSGSTWVATGTTSNSALQAIKYSGDGINWSNADDIEFVTTQAVPSLQAYDVRWDGVKFITTLFTFGSANGSNDQIKYSFNGRRWFRAFSPNTGSNTIWWGIYPNGQGQYLATAWPNASGSNSLALLSNTGTGISTFATITPSISWPNTIVGFPKGVIWDGKRWILGVRANQSVSQPLNTLQVSYDAVNWLTARSGGFVGAGFEAKGLAFTSNYSFRETNLDIFDFVPSFYRSTNMIVTYASSMMINDTLMVDRPTGFVGVNNYNPQVDLDVNGVIKASTIHIGTYTGFSTLGPFTSNIRLGLIQGDAYKPTGTSWSITSDQRIKENIVDADLERCYTDITNLRLRRFKYISSFLETTQAYDTRVLGFIAQEVSSIVPKAITKGPGYGFDDLYSINVDQLQMSLFGAVKKTIQDKEYMQSTIQGQQFTIQTLLGTQTTILSTLNGLQGR